VQAQNELIHIERIASLGKLSSSVAHELNNPLSGILVYTKLIHKQLSNPELYASKRESMLKHLKLIENETKRCGDIVKGLLDFSRKEQQDFETKHLHEILQETYELMTHPVTRWLTSVSQYDLSARIRSCFLQSQPDQTGMCCHHCQCH
jgi:two-component system, NtrC family, sensor kinase